MRQVLSVRKINWSQLLLLEASVMGKVKHCWVTLTGRRKPFFLPQVHSFFWNVLQLHNNHKWRACLNLEVLHRKAEYRQKWVLLIPCSPELQLKANPRSGFFS